MILNYAKLNDYFYSISKINILKQKTEWKIKKKTNNIFKSIKLDLKIILN